MFADKRLQSRIGVKRSDLDGFPGNRVQVIITEVQFLQGQKVIEGSLVDQHQLVVVQNEVVKLRHATEGVVAYFRQPIAADRSDTQRERKRSCKTILRQEGAALCSSSITWYLLRCRALRFSRSAKAYGVMKEMVFLDNVRSTSRVMFAKSFLFTLTQMSLFGKEMDTRLTETVMTQHKET